MGDGVDLNRIVITISLDNLTRRLTTPSPASENFRVNSAAVIISFLSIVLLASICANCLLIVSITSSHTLRKVNIYLVVLNFAILNVFASVSHVVLSIFFVSLEGDWDYFGDVTYYLCSLHAIVVQVSTVEITLCIVHMCADRIFVLIRPSEYRKYVTRSEQTVAIATTWIISVISCVPIIPSTLNITGRCDRYRRVPAQVRLLHVDRSNVAYCLFVLVVFVLLPVTFIGRLDRLYRLEGRRRHQEIGHDEDEIFLQRISSEATEFLERAPDVQVGTGRRVLLSRSLPAFHIGAATHRLQRSVVDRFELYRFGPVVKVGRHVGRRHALHLDAHSCTILRLRAWSSTNGSTSARNSTITCAVGRAIRFRTEDRHRCIMG
ncbi:Uncharacterised protein r2_g2578 [Pycnogonum litorale]